MSAIPFDKIMKDIFSGEEVGVSKAIKTILVDDVKSTFGYDVSEKLNDRAFTDEKLTISDFVEMVSHIFFMDGMIVLKKMVNDDEVDNGADFNERLDVLTSKANEIMEHLRKRTTQITAICVKALELNGHMVIAQPLDEDDEEDGEGIIH